MKARIIFLSLTLLLLITSSCQNEDEAYMCKPCKLECDKLKFSEDGICPHCKMELIKKDDLVEELTLNEIKIKEGSGTFLIEGGVGNEEKTIKVFYHKPKNFNSTSKIMIVIPGAGRNADSYRDAWIGQSEKYSLLILSPMYSNDEYEFEDYHLGGLITNSNLKANMVYDDSTNTARLDEATFSFKVNSNFNEWIFNDFDRLFDLVVNVLDSKQDSYDMFGHSAGGHILHRLAIFQNISKANRILASNSSFYTLPTFEADFPFGCKNMPITHESLKYTFKKRLVVLLGELDNENETRGTFLQSKSANKQGLHRLERGKYFYNKSKAIAEEHGFDFNWELVIVPNVGHDYRKMGDAAADYLYNID